MERLKGVLLYTLGLASLVVVSVLFTGRMETDFEPLPTATPAVQNTPTAAVTDVAEVGCRLTQPGSSYGYQSDAPFTTSLVSADRPGDRLMISGTVYASDCLTPLPNILIEIWQNDGHRNDPAGSTSLRAQLRTNAQGQYEFTTIKPGHSQSWPAHIHYRLTLPDGSNPLTTMIFFDDVAQDPDRPLTGSTNLVNLTNTGSTNRRLLRGSFDLVLPVEPLVEPEEDQADLSDCLATPHNTNARLEADAPFTNQLALPGVPGPRLRVSGTVYAEDRQTPLPGALLEVWQADAQGHYSSNPNILRARLRTDLVGHFQFRTIKPGPVQVGCQRLPAHLNYLVSYKDSRPLFMMQFFAGDPYLANQPPMRAGVVTPLVREKDPADPFWHSTFDIVLPIRPDDLLPTQSGNP
jgi:catechol 1,2-dioxygenase